MSALLLLLAACHPSVPSPDTSGDTSAPVDTAPPPDTGETGDTGDTGAPPVSILVNEIMAENDGAVLDEDGEASDWIELFNAGAGAVDLSAFAVSDDWTDPGLGPLAGGTVLGPGEFLVLWADGEQGAGHVPFKLDSQGESVGVFDGEGEPLDWVSYPTLSADCAWARIPDGSEGWEEVARGTPGLANKRLVERSDVLVDTGATWSFLDTGVYPGDTWTTVGFDDTAWATGPSPLGYGDEAATTVSYGPDSNNKYATTWFRVRFWSPAVVDDLAQATLTLRVDDGAILYLDGAEVVRQHVPDGVVTAETLASFTASGSDETSYKQYAVDLTTLAEGEHVLAAEVHQVSVTSSDIIFDATLSLVQWIEASEDLP